MHFETLLKDKNAANAWGHYFQCGPSASAISLDEWEQRGVVSLNLYTYICTNRELLQSEHLNLKSNSFVA